MYDPYEAAWVYQPGYYAPWNWLGARFAPVAGVGVTWAGWNAWWNHSYPQYFCGSNWWGPGGFRYNNINVHHNWLHGRVWNPAGRWAGYYPGWRPGNKPGIPPGFKAAPYLAGANLYHRPVNRQFLASPVITSAPRPALGVQTYGTAGPRKLPARGESFPQVLKTKAPPRPGQAGQNIVFGDKQGNVYRRGAQGQWQKRLGNQWSQVEPEPPQVLRGKAPKKAYQPPSGPQGTLPQFDSSALNREFQARQRGEMRTQQFQIRQQVQPGFQPFGGGLRGGRGVQGAGEGFRSGGGRRR
jgi:hypothetical protein